jgi:hypothetical protein
MARGPAIRTIEGGYHPAPTGATYAIKATTAINTAQFLGTLVTIPAVLDEAFGGGPQRGVKTRPPNHLLIQVPAGAANPVYMTFDNNTAPVVGGPGIELEPGTIYKFEEAGESLLRGGIKFGDQASFTVNSLSAMQFIATAATVINFHFSD